MPPVESKSMDSPSFEAAARASFLKMTPRKWRLVRTFEGVLRMVLPLLPSPRAIEDTDALPKSILVVEYWNLGDLAIVVPLLKKLRRSYPGARISLLVNAGLASFLDGQGMVDEVIPVRVPWAQHFSRWKKYNLFSGLWLPFFQVLREVRRKKVDMVFSGRMDVRDNFLLWLTGAVRRIGYGFAGGGFLLTDRVAPNLSRPHRADIWLHLLEALGKPTERELDGFRLAEAEMAAAEAFLSERGIPTDAFLIGVHPGARIAVRRWGDEAFAEVAKELLRDPDVHVLWFAEPGLASRAPAHPRCHLAAVEFRTFLAVLARCKLLVGNDSGPMHIANLLNVPVVAVFGSQKPEWFGPLGPRDKIVIRPEFWCRPCFDYCIYDQPYCLRTITPERVIQEVSAVVEEIREGTSRVQAVSAG